MINGKTFGSPTINWGSLGVFNQIIIDTKKISCQHLFPGFDIIYHDISL